MMDLIWVYIGNKEFSKTHILIPIKNGIEPGGASDILYPCKGQMRVGRVVFCRKTERDARAQPFQADGLQLVSRCRKDL
jgi:hypothetical protein